jgi:hypothetical protein
MTDRAAHIFVDANTALHFLRPDQIDWCELIGCAEVVLVAAPILHRELEHQKVHNPSGKLRKRAAAYLKWLVEFVRDPGREVRAHTAWHFIAVEPQIDFPAHSLTATIADDHLIASVISYAPPAGAAVYVATADIGLEIKLRHWKIAPLFLPDTAKLPDEPDELQKEVQELRRKVAQRHLPKLSLITALDSERHPFAVGAEAIAASAPSPAEMRGKYPPMVGPERLTPADKAALPSDRRYELLCADMCGVTENVADYNKKLQSFLVKYEEYCSALRQWEELAALTVAVELTLSNEGTAPATDIDIILRFPGDIVVLEEDDFPERPEEPKPPERADILNHFSAFTAYDPSSLLQLPDTDFPMNLTSSARADQEEHAVHYWSKNLKHGFTETLDPIYFRFPDRQAVRQFQVEYEISSAELPEPITGTIHFVTST